MCNYPEQSHKFSCRRNVCETVDSGGFQKVLNATILNTCYPKILNVVLQEGFLKVCGWVEVTSEHKYYSVK